MLDVCGWGELGGGGGEGEGIDMESVGEGYYFQDFSQPQVLAAPSEEDDNCTIVTSLERVDLERSNLHLFNNHHYHSSPLTHACNVSHERSAFTAH